MSSSSLRHHRVAFRATAPAPVPAPRRDASACGDFKGLDEQLPHALLCELTESPEELATSPPSRARAPTPVCGTPFPVSAHARQ